MAEQQIGIRIGLQGVQGVTSGLAQVETGLSGLAAQAGSAGAVLARVAPQLAAAFSIGAFTQFIRGTAEAVDQMNDLADATGASIEEISKLDAVVRRSGGTFDTAAGALVKFNDVLRNATPGSGPAEALRAIGLEAAALRRLDPAVALRQTAQALAGFADNADKARLVQELFGRSVRDVAPLLKDLADAGDVAAGVTASQAEEVDRLNKQLAAFRANLTDLGRGVALEIAPLVAAIADAFRDGSDTSQQLAVDLSAVRVPLEAITILASDVGFVFKGVGREIGAIAAQLGALARADLEGFKAISEAVKRDAEEARKALDEFQARVLSRAPARGRPEPLDFGPREVLRELPQSGGGNNNNNNDAARRADAARQAYARLNQTLQQSIRLQEEELALGGSISAARRIQIDGYQKLSEIAGQLNGAQRVTIRNLIEEQAANARLADTNRQAQEDAREQLRVIEQQNAERTRYLETLASSTTTAREAADAAADEVIGLVAGQRALEELRIARIEDTAAELERKAVITADEQIAEQYRAEAEQLRRLAALRRQIVTINADKEIQDANKKAADDTAAAWQRITDDISQSLTDAIIEGGVSGREALERAFKSLVLRPIIQAAVEPLARQITDILGAGNPTGQKGGQSGQGQTGAIGQFIQGQTGQQLLTALSYADAFMSARAGKWGEAIGTGVGAYFGGPAGAAIGKTIGSVADKLLRGGAGTPSVGSVVTVNASGARTGGPDPSRILDNFNRDTDTALKLLAGQSVGLLNSLALATGGTAQFEALAKFTADNNDPSFGEFFLTRDGRGVGDLGGARKFASDPRAGFEAFATDVAAITRQALADIDLPAFARRQIDALGTDATLDQLTQVGQSIQATIAAIGALRTALDPLAGSLGLLANQSSDSLFRLAELSGGFDALGSNVQTFYSAFVSEADRAAAETARITETLGKFGIALPQTRGEFADLVQAQIALGEAGQPALAALLGVAGSFDQLTTRADTLQRSLSDALIGAAERFAPDQVLRLRTDRIRLDLAEAGVQIDLQQLLGASTADIEEFARAFVSTGTASAEAQIAVLNAASALAALRESSGGATQVLQQRTQLEERLLQLQGNEAEIQRRQLAEVTDAYNRSLLEQIFALENASRASQQFSSSLQGFFNTPDSLALRGNTRRLAADSSGQLFEFDLNDFAQQRSLLTEADIPGIIARYDDADRTRAEQLLAGNPFYAGLLLDQVARTRVAIPDTRADEARNALAQQMAANAASAPEDPLLRAQRENTEALKRLTGSLSDYLDSLVGSDVLGLSPEEQQRQLQGQFREAAQRALTGDAAAGERALELGRRTIEATRANLGNGAAGALANAEVVALLRQILEAQQSGVTVAQGSVQVTARGLSAVESAARGTTDAVAQQASAQRLADQRLVGFEA